jgi:hypothetical protein
MTLLLRRIVEAARQRRSDYRWHRRRPALPATGAKNQKIGWQSQVNSTTPPGLDRTPRSIPIPTPDGSFRQPRLLGDPRGTSEKETTYGNYQ